MPTSAAARAGASFTPSPAMATRRPCALIPNPGDWLGGLGGSCAAGAVVSWRAMVREVGHGADRRASVGRGIGGAVSGGAGPDRGAARPGDLAAGAGPHD